MSDLLDDLKARQALRRDWCEEYEEPYWISERGAPHGTNQMHRCRRCGEVTFLDDGIGHKPGCPVLTTGDDLDLAIAAIEQLRNPAGVLVQLDPTTREEVDLIARVTSTPVATVIATLVALATLQAEQRREARRRLGLPDPGDSP